MLTPSEREEGRRLLARVGPHEWRFDHSFPMAVGTRTVVHTYYETLMLGTTDVPLAVKFMGGKAFETDGSKAERERRRATAELIVWLKNHAEELLEEVQCKQ